MTGLFPASTRLDKTEAVTMLAHQAGLLHEHPFGPDVDAALARLPRLTNEQVQLRSSAEIPELRRTLYQPASQREIAPPIFTNGRPACFPAQSGLEFSPAFEVLDLPGGVLAQVARAPVVLAADGISLIQDYSSRYAGLVHGLDFELSQLLADAIHVTGSALVLCDDVHPLNYSHWLLDELPRIAFLGERRDVTLITSEHDRPFKKESLSLCGFPDSKVIYLGDYQAVQADQLLVPCDVAAMPHPAHKAAPWVMNFLRARLGFAALARHLSRLVPAKLYVSRDDAEGRRIINEQALLRILEPAGYQRVTMAGRSLADQIALFCKATHVVGAHGAGLTNLAFAPDAARVLEIFPATYGTPTYYVLAAGQGHRYATYLAHDVVPGNRAQTDDVRLDIDDFRRCCEFLL